MGRRRAQKSQCFAKKLGEEYADEFTQIFIEKFILRFAERFADGVAKKVAEILTPERLAAAVEARAAEKRVVEAVIPTAFESVTEDDEEPASVNLDPTNIAFRPRKDKSAAEISNELVVSVTEQFVKEFQQQLDTLRKNITACPNPPLPLPPPVSSIEMFPPPPFHDDGTTTMGVDYNEDDVAAEKRLKQLNIYHKQQLLEVDQIVKYEHAVIDNDYDEWHDEISSAFKRARYNHLKSIESYTVKLGYSPYGEGAEEKCASAILEFQEAQLPCRDSEE
ncbi:hypothetical protein ABFS83_11G117100 [Erythranthe nasuta]